MFSHPNVYFWQVARRKGQSASWISFHFRSGFIDLDVLNSTNGDSVSNPLLISSCWLVLYLPSPSQHRPPNQLARNVKPRGHVYIYIKWHWCKRNTVDTYWSHVCHLACLMLCPDLVMDTKWNRNGRTLFNIHQKYPIKFIIFSCLILNVVGGRPNLEEPTQTDTIAQHHRQPIAPRHLPPHNKHPSRKAKKILLTL